MAIPNYTDTRCVKEALNRIKNPPKGINYEHHVSTWAASMLKKVFQHDNYAMSSEVIDPNEGSKPDFLIEKISDEQGLVRHLYVELKKVKGDHFEKALDKATKHIRVTLEQESIHVKECFVVVQRGLDIGFFEYHARAEDLEGVPNFRSCVSLTQPLETDEDMPFTEQDLRDDPTIQHDPMDNIHPSLGNLVKFDNQNRRIITQLPETTRLLSYGNYSGEDPNLVSILKDARQYNVPCVFNIEKDTDIINYLFYYMSVQTPRVIVTDP